MGDFLKGVVKDVSHFFSSASSLVELSCLKKEEKRRTYLESVQQNCRVFQYWVSNMRDLHYHEQNQLMLRINPFFVQDIVDELKNVFAHSFYSKGVNFAYSVDVPESEAAISNDYERVSNE